MLPMISIKEFTFQYKNLAEPTLKNISLQILPGEKVLIAGRSGSGKSTLAHCLNGLIPFSYEGTSTGTLFVHGKDPREAGIFDMSSSIGTILQDQNAQFVGLTVGEDVAFAAENKATPVPEMKKQVQEALLQVEMESFIDRSPHELSGGQKQRVSLAGILATDTPILLFDEPLANLDPLNGEKAVQLINDIHKQTKKTIVIVEHRMEDILKLGIDKLILLSEGKVLFSGNPEEALKKGLLPKAGLREPLYLEALKETSYKIDDNTKLYPLEQLDPALLHAHLLSWLSEQTSSIIEKSNKEAILQVKDVSFTYNHERQALSNIFLTVYKKEILALMGNNGAGKSTLSHVICGYLRPQNGSILLNGECINHLSIAKRGRHIGYVLQNANHMITEKILIDEVSCKLRQSGLPEDQVAKAASIALKISGLYGHRNWPIDSLSYGQKKRAAIASILVLKPDILILDEPTAGQDFSHYREFMDFIHLLRQKGMTIVLITHDIQLALEYSDRTALFHNGSILAVEETAKLFSMPDVFHQANLTKSSLYHLAESASIPADSFIKKYLQSKRKEPQNEYRYLLYQS
ncbi:ABC transporter ATP-binding protein [Bacillus gobiensis]|uniref:ABC transporter ATP-binding protein n=1 Tax=Bacillus gobiensis TaxID=1441095 RepID=UPI003D262381